MKYDLRPNAPEDEVLEIVFGRSGDSVLYDKEDSQVFYIQDINENEVCLGTGDIDLLITALEKLKSSLDAEESE